MHADGKSEYLKNLIDSLPGGPLVNLDAENEHVPGIERLIRVVKEECRATSHGLPFHKIMKLLTTNIVLNTVNMINLFPTKGGIPDSLRHKTIISGKTLDFQQHLRLQLGQYCQVHEEEIPRNRQYSRTKGEICSVLVGIPKADIS